MTTRNEHRKISKGFSLVELIVAVGLFAIVMSLATGAYLIMISVNRQAQGLATGIDNLSFALETMTRNIRTGINYQCSSCSGATSITVTSSNGGSSQVAQTFTYSLANGAITQSIGAGSAAPLTDPSVTVTALTFIVTGQSPYSSGQDIQQPYVTILVSGSVTTGPGKTQSFSIETGAVMRGTDL